MFSEMRLFEAVSAFSEKCRGLILTSGPALLLLSACAVGPDFQKPAPPPVTSYTASPLQATEAAPGVVGGDAQRFLAGSDVPGDWWTLFHSKPLNDLIEQGLKNNPGLKSAEASLRQTHEQALGRARRVLPRRCSGLRGIAPGAIECAGAHAHVQRAGI